MAERKSNETQSDESRRRIKSCSGSLSDSAAGEGDASRKSDQGLPGLATDDKAAAPLPERIRPGCASAQCAASPRPGARAASPRPGVRADSLWRGRQLPCEELRQLAADAERVLRPQQRAKLGPAPCAQAWAERRVSAPFLGPRADVGTVGVHERLFRQAERDDPPRPPSWDGRASPLHGTVRQRGLPARAGSPLHAQGVSTYNARVREAVNQRERERAGGREARCRAAARVQAAWRGLFLRRMLANVHKAARVLQQRVRYRWPRAMAQQRRQMRTLRAKQRGVENSRSRAAWDGSPIRVTGGRTSSRPVPPQPALLARPASPAPGADKPRNRQRVYIRLHALAKEWKLRLKEKQARREAELRAHELDGCTFKPSRFLITGYNFASPPRRDEPDSDWEVAPIGLRLKVFRELLSLGALAQPHEGPLRWDGTRRAVGELLTTADLVLEVVKPHTLARKCAYVDALPAGAKAPATIYVSHAWKYTFSDVVSALEQAVGEDDGVWFCALINNQHETGSMTYDFLEGEFRRNVESVGRVVLVFAPWSAPITLTRAWCLFEIFVCVQRGIPLEVIMPAAQLIDFATALVDDFDSVALALSKIALDEAEATKPEDKANIMRAVEASVGLGKLDKQVLRELRAWLLQTGMEALAAEPENWGLTSAIGKLLHDQGRLGEAEPLLRRALEGRERQLGVNHPSTLTSVNNLASLLQDQGKLVEAELLFRRALEGREEQLGASHPRTLTAVNNLALLLKMQGRLGEAEPLYRRALRGQEKQLGASHLDTLTSVNNLASLLQDQGKLGEAEPLYRRALKGREEQLGANHPETLTAVNNLALLLKTQGRLGEAEPLYRRALGGQEKQLGASHPDTLTSMNNLALLLKMQGKLGEAEPLYRRALEGQEKQLGANHPETLTSVNNLAQMLKTQGKLGEAEPLFRRALQGCEKQLGASHPSTLTSVSNLATLLEDQGNLDEAEHLFRRALEGREEQLGASHPDTLASVNNLAQMLDEQGNLDEAEPLYWRALEGSERQLGASHPSTLTTVNCLAGLLQDQGKLDEAELLYKRALEGREEQLGTSHPSTLTSLNHLASLLKKQGKLDEAEPLFRCALERREEQLGTSHPNTLTSVLSLAGCLREAGRVVEATSLFRRELDACAARLGDEDEETLASARNLVLLLDQTESTEEVRQLRARFRL
eukprot:CAMPEP_0179845960 /NCGR_PEP_ID=MMETSP0982-20121206/5299_1 /TAXON_ID=483367 /ORGANISM="non described non described, Strain CCMP 2436" /LENGTH=1184 /DNA_ID=CAMNT_0021731055 /DNA_START=41 /DNA_END=3597 /DNA_ORIENTATION=-